MTMSNRGVLANRRAGLADELTEVSVCLLSLVSFDAAILRRVLA